MIDHEFVERVVREGRGYRTLQRHLNHRFANEWEDAMQEALLALWKNRGNLKNRVAAMSFFQAVVEHTAARYRSHVMDRAVYCEVQERDAIVHPDDLPESVRREAEIRAAEERLEHLLSRVRVRHRNTFREWRRRGYRCLAHSQSCALSVMVKALAEAAGVDWRSRSKFKNSYFPKKGEQV